MPNQLHYKKRVKVAIRQSVITGHIQIFQMIKNMSIDLATLGMIFAIVRSSLEKGKLSLTFFSLQKLGSKWVKTHAYICNEDMLDSLN